MKFKTKYFPATLIFVLALTLLSCHKKWKKPTEVSFRFQLKENSNSGIIKFNHASLWLTKLSVSGDRKQSPSHIDFQQTVNGKNDFFITSPSQIYRFDIPQGTYSALNLRYETSNDENTPGLVVDASYIDSTGTTYPLQFIFSAGDVNTLLAKNTSGGNEIILVEGRTANATIYLNPNYWFAPVTQHIMEDVDIEMVNGTPTIVIDEDSNDDIYELVISRLKDGNECVIR